MTMAMAMANDNGWIPWNKVFRKSDAGRYHTYILVRLIRKIFLILAFPAGAGSWHFLILLTSIRKHKPVPRYMSK